MPHLHLHFKVALPMCRSVNLIEIREDAIVATELITISTDSWLNRRAHEVEKGAPRRRVVIAYIGSSCK